MVHLLDISGIDTVCKTNFTQGPQTQHDFWQICIQLISELSENHKKVPQ